MELRSVAYNPTQVPGMAGMQGFQAMPGMAGTQAMPGMAGMAGMQAMPGTQAMPGMAGMAGMQAMPGMAGMQGAPMAGGLGMYPASGLVNLDVDADPGCVSLDLGGPIPCSPCAEPMMHPQYQYQQCPAPEPAPEVYVVKKGDTVYKIAKRYGTSMQAIILANNLHNPDLIYPGQILYIPKVSTGEFYG